MLGPTDVLFGGVVPGLIALSIRLSSRRFAPRAAWGDAAAIALGFAAGQLALAAQPAAVARPDLAGAAGAWLAALPRAAAALLSPREASLWLPWGAALAAAVGWLASRGRSLRVVAVALGLALAVGLPLRLLWGSVFLTSRWSAAEAALRVGAIAAALLVVGWLATSGGSPEPSDRPRRGPDWLRPLLSAVIALGLAILLATSGSLSYARLAGALFAAILGGLLGAVGPVPRSSVGTAGPVVVTIVGGLLILGVAFAEVSVTHACLVAAALAAAPGRLPATDAPSAETVRGRALVLRVALCLVPLGIAVGGSAAAFVAAVKSQPANPYTQWKAP